MEILPLREVMMQWIVALEAENNPIVLGRLLNAFRRKGVAINTLTLGSRAAELSLMALVESPEDSVEHIFHFLRRMVGVRDVTYYRRESSGMASFIFIETDDHSSVAKILADFPLSKLVFASQGKYLLEIGEKHRTTGPVVLASEDGFLPFARVRTSSAATEEGRLADA
jgi:acetolactate synthase regulatory subunit